jgi:nucleotide-binding universal stress UspA family protein
MKILLAVDGSAYSKKMLAYLATHDSLLATQNSYYALYVQSALPPRVRSAVGKDMADSYYADESAKVLSPVRKFLQRHGIDAQCEAKVGQAGATIAKLAEQGKFDLVVMGSHGHGALATLVMGSIATQVLAHCKVPVLLVR